MDNNTRPTSNEQKLYLRWRGDRDYSTGDWFIARTGAAVANDDRY